jgi:hypothetical protein
VAGYRYERALRCESISFLTNQSRASTIRFGEEEADAAIFPFFFGGDFSLLSIHLSTHRLRDLHSIYRSTTFGLERGSSCFDTSYNRLLGIQREGKSSSVHLGMISSWFIASYYRFHFFTVLCFDLTSSAIPNSSRSYGDFFLGRTYLHLESTCFGVPISGHVVLSSKYPSELRYYCINRQLT